MCTTEQLFPCYFPIIKLGASNIGFVYKFLLEFSTGASSYTFVLANSILTVSNRRVLTY